MAAAPSVPSNTVNMVVNGIDLVVPKGELVVEAVKRLGLEIPIFCYHPRMKPVGMCRMCLVETGMKMPDGTIRMMPKPAAACTMPVSEGLIINTDSESLRKDRKGVLEFLLINHPLDCPICDRGGECPLQNNTLFYGPSTSRFVEMKRHAPKAFPLSDYVTLDLERCIQCARCVRFTEEISGDSQLAFRFRGSKTQPITFSETKFTSKFSGNVIEICPVGALTNRKYRFRARPWDLETKAGICTLCSNGCNIWMDHRAGKLVRINGRTNEAINEEWTCDAGKFGHEFYNDAKRLDSVFVRKNDELVKGTWGEAFTELRETFVGLGNQAGLIVGTGISNEGMFAATKFFRDHVGSPNIDHRIQSNLVSFTLPAVPNTIESFEQAKSILIFGASLADESPILFLRVRKAWLNKGTKVITATEHETEADSFAHLVLRHNPGTGHIIAAALSGEVTPEDASAKTGVDAREIIEAKEILSEGAIITTSGIYNDANASQSIGSLLKLNASFNCYAVGANERGAQLMNVVPETGGKDTREMLIAAARGELKALWLLDVDLFNIGLEREFVIKVLENVEFLVVQTSKRNETFYYSSLALPIALPAESDGTFTNMEGTVQNLSAVIPAVGESKPIWRTFDELTMRISNQAPYMQAKDVLKDIPAFANA
jgi:NADH-quinone oxidoreductase subunit G